MNPFQMILNLRGSDEFGRPLSVTEAAGHGEKKLGFRTFDQGVDDAGILVSHPVILNQMILGLLDEEKLSLCRLRIAHRAFEQMTRILDDVGNIGCLAWDQGGHHRAERGIIKFLLYMMAALIKILIKVTFDMKSGFPA